MNIIPQSAYVDVTELIENAGTLGVDRQIAGHEGIVSLISTGAKVKVYRGTTLDDQIAEGTIASPLGVNNTTRKIIVPQTDVVFDEAVNRDEELRFTIGLDDGSFSLLGTAGAALAYADAALTRDVADGETVILDLQCNLPTWLATPAPPPPTSPPVNAYPASYTVAEGATLALTGLSITDADTTGPLTMVLGVDDGTIAATSGNGVTVTGSGTDSVSLTGTLANLNAYLASIARPIYTPGAPGTVTLTITTNDGVTPDEDEVTITVEAGSPPAARPDVGTYTLGGATGAAIPGVTSGVYGATLRHQYSKVGAWNCDQTRFFLLNRDGGTPGTLFYDATTTPPTPVNITPFSSNEFRWHHSNPDVVILTRGNQVLTRNIVTGAETSILTFSGYTSVAFGPGEGNISNDGTWAVIAANLTLSWPDPPNTCFLLNLSTSAYYVINHGFGFVDWAGMSPSGTYVVVNGGSDNADANVDRTKIFARTDIVAGGASPTPVTFLNTFGRPSHFDVAYDADGTTEILVGVSKKGGGISDPEDGRIIKVRMSDGQRTILTPDAAPTYYYYGRHTSARCTAAPGKVVSNFRGTNGNAYLINTGTPGSVVDLGATNEDIGDYWRESQPTVSPDGTQVMWAVWDGSKVRTKLTVLPAATPPPPGPPPPPPPPAPPASGGPCGMAILNAPASIPVNQTLVYQLQVTSGSASAWQTWIVDGDTEGPNPTGAGAIIGQNDAVGGGPGGVYTQDISDFDPGDYKIWGRVNDSGSCNGSWIMKPITFTAASGPPSAPPPPAPPPVGAVPLAILNMPTAPAVSKWTTASMRTTDWTSNGAGDFSHMLFSGGYDSEYQDVFVGAGMWNLTFAGADVSQAISGAQFRGRCGVGASQDGALSVRIQTKLPTAAAIQAYRSPGQHEVVCYPNIYAGHRLGQTASWPSQQPGVILPGLPVKFKDIRSHWIGAKSWTLNNLSGGVLGTGWIAHDMRVCNSGRRPSSYQDSLSMLLGEVLVTRMHLPADRNLSEGSTSGHYRGEFVIWGCTFRLFIQLGATNTCLIQLRTTTNLPNHFPMHEVWKFLMSKTYRQIGHTTGHRISGQGLDDPLISGESWYHQCGTGIEMEHDTYDLLIDTYYERMNRD